MVKRRERRDGGCVRSIFRGMYMLEARNAADRSSQFALRFQTIATATTSQYNEP